MPSVKQAGGSQFAKDVDFVTKDDDDGEQIAAGIVMVPDKADLQNDFVREDTLRSFADQFGTFYEAGEAGGGVMHAVFPDGWLDLQRNQVLDEPEEIGGEEVAAGAWVQEWAITDDQLWALIEDDIISGYSIGAVNVQWKGPYEQGEVDDVAVPDELGDELIYELIDGIVREISGVDIPAVPDAQILEASAKAAGGTEKRLGDYLGDPDGFVEEALARGHSEEEAERLWDLLNRAVEVEGSSEPGTKGRLTNAVKTIVDVLTLDDAGRSASPERSTERSADGNPDDSAGVGESSDKDAAGGDTPADGGTDAADPTDTDMSDDTPDGGDGDKSLAERNAEQINELSEQVSELTAALTGKEQTTEVELDGETYEVPKSQLKSVIQNGEAGSGEVEQQVKDLHDRLDAIKRQSGITSDQLAGNAGGDGDDNSGSGLDELGKELS